MKNQQDSKIPDSLLAQIAALAGEKSLDIRLQADQEGIVILRGETVLHRFDAPVKAGAIINFLRRHEARPVAETLPGDIPLGPYVFHPRRAVLSLTDQPDITLTDKERDILAALWNAPDKALDREALLQAVWAYADGVETHTLETHIYRLRRKIETDPGAAQLLVNEDGLYRLAI